MQSFSYKVAPAIFSVFFTILAFPAANYAQDLDDVAFSGRVSDANDAPIVGATVTATLAAINLERTVTTDGGGRYRFVELPPGVYKISVSQSGFGTQEKTDIETVAGQNVRLDFNLAPGDIRVEQTVNVEDTAEVIDVTRTIVGGTVTEREIEELPNNARNPLDLVLTLGGVAEEALSTRDLAEDRDANPRSTPFEQGNFSLSGGASNSNNITIDGLDNNDDRSARDRFQPSLESIAEVQIITNQFSAEYGRASGGRINLRTKAGTKNLRGRAFFFFRDSRLNANSFYNNSRGIARLPFTEYNPGFTLSGPVALPFLYDGKARTFFSVAYEYLKLEDTTLIDTFVPVGANPRFALPASTGGAQTCDNGNAAACTNAPPTAGLLAPYTTLLDTPNTNHVVTARVDHRLFKGNDITFGYQFGRRANRRSPAATTTRIEDALQTRNNNTDAFNVTDNQVFGTNLVNQFRFQYSIFKPSYQTDDPFAPVVLIGYRNPLTGNAQTLVAGNSTGSNLQNFADTRRETRLQFQDSLTFVAGAHTLKGGFDVQRVDSKATALGDATGTFNFNSVLNFQNNVLSRYRQNFGTATDVKNTYWGAFGNDEWRASENVTINYGLRYERETAVDDTNNFGPRLGIAWSPFKEGKGVIRAGAGIFYNRVLLRTVGDFIQNSSNNLFQFDTNGIGTSGADARRVAVLSRVAQQFPNAFASVADLRNVLTSLGYNANLGFATNTATNANPLRSVHPNLKIPESYQFNVGFERELTKGIVFEANYTVNKTARLWREFNPNVPIVPAGFEDFTAYLLANPFTFTNANGTLRTYRFVLGSTTDGGGVVGENGGSCSTRATATCVVNLNSINGTTAFPSALSVDSANSVGTPLGIALAAVARFRPDPNLDETERVASVGNSFYQGLILELRSRLRKFDKSGFGASFRAVYTLSSLKDDGLNNTTNAEINADFSREWARGLQDRRHRFALTGVFDTPGWFGRLRFSPLFRFGSSAPFSLGYGVDRNLNDVSTDRPNFSGDVNEIRFRNPNSPFPTALAAQFSLPPIGARSGNLPRNAGRGPRQYVFDLSVTREWRFGEKSRLRPIVEFGNLLNLSVFSFGSEFINFNTLDSTPTANQLAEFQNFLVPTRTYRQRTVRLGVRFDF